MKTLARAIYAVFGALAVGLGLVALIRPAVALPPEAFSPLSAHLIREQGAEGIFIGLMSFWCLLNFSARRPVHLALLIFAATFAGIHWAEYFQARRSLASPLLNTIPFLTFLVTAPFSHASRRARS